MELGVFTPTYIRMRNPVPVQKLFNSAAAIMESTRFWRKVFLLTVANVLCIFLKTGIHPRGYFHIRKSAGGVLDLTSSLEAKFGARSSQVHQLRGKTWEVLLPQDAKVGKNPNFGVISEIQRAKFGVFVIYIFGGKIWGSNKNFGGKFWGQAPRPPNLEVYPSGVSIYVGRIRGG